MFRRHDDECGVGETLRVQGRHHRADRLVCVIQRRQQAALWHAVGSVATGQCRRSSELFHLQLLSDADRLEIHPEQRRNPYGVDAVVIESVDFVDDRRDLQIVVSHGQGEAVGDRDAGNRRRDFRGVQIVEARARRSVEELIRRVLVGPCGAAASCLDQLEHVIDPGELVRRHGAGATGRRIPRQLRRIDRRPREGPPII